MRKPGINDFALKGMSAQNDWRSPHTPLGYDAPKEFHGQTLHFDDIDWEYVENGDEVIAGMLESVLRQNHPGIEVLLHPLGGAIYVSELAVLDEAKRTLVSLK